MKITAWLDTFNNRYLFVQELDFIDPPRKGDILTIERFQFIAEEGRNHLFWSTNQECQKLEMSFKFKAEGEMPSSAEEMLIDAGFERVEKKQRT